MFSKRETDDLLKGLGTTPGSQAGGTKKAEPPKLVPPPPTRKEVVAPIRKADPGLKDALLGEGLDPDSASALAGSARPDAASALLELLLAAKRERDETFDLA